MRSGRDVLHGLVDLLGLEHERAQRPTLVVGGRFEHRLDLVAESLVLLRRESFPGLASLHVEEHRA
jgi:hypothetical protein